MLVELGFRHFRWGIWVNLSAGYLAHMVQLQRIKFGIAEMDAAEFDY